MGLVQTDHLLEREDAERADEPLPKVGRMKNTQQPEGKVKEVGPVEHLHIELPQTLTRQPSLVVQHIILELGSDMMAIGQTSKLPDSRTQRILHST